MKKRVFKVIGLIFVMSLIFSLCVITASAEEPVADKWSQNEFGTWQYTKDGSIVTDSSLWIKDAYYAFDSDGSMVTDAVYDNHYYDASGKRVVKQGWFSITRAYSGNEGEQKETYWLYSKNSAGDLAQEEWIWSNGNYYYFDYQCTMVRNCSYDTEDGRAVFDSNGAWINKSGWVKLTSDGSYVKDNWYYLENGYCQTVDDWKWIGNSYYYFDWVGVMATGEYEIYDYETGDWTTYFFRNDGTWVESGWFDASTTHVFNRRDVKLGMNYSDPDWYYIDSSTHTYVTGWKSIGGNWYYFNNDGRMFRDTALNDGGKTYIFGDDGVMATGWVQFSDVSYYLEGMENVKTEADLDKVKVTKYTELSNWYYADSQGVAVKDLGWKMIGSTWYYFTDDYSYYNGCYMYTIYTGVRSIYDEKADKSEVFAFDKNGAWIEKPNGWLQGCGRTYFDYDNPKSGTYGKYINTDSWNYFENGKPVQNEWRQFGGNWYYFGYNGIMYYGVQSVPCEGINYFGTNGVWVEKPTGWIQDCYVGADGKMTTENEQWYYFNGRGAVTHNGWNQLNGTWYYFDKNYGTMARGINYVSDDKKYYLFDDNTGAWVSSGWYKRDKDYYGDGVNDLWSYVDSNGEVVRNGWKQINNKWYYFSNGIMETGVVSDNGKYWALGKDGVLQTKAGWFTDSYGNWYCTNADGSIVTNDIKKISGKSYAFDSDGELMCYYPYYSMSINWYYVTDTNKVFDTLYSFDVRTGQILAVANVA